MNKISLLCCVSFFLTISACANKVGANSKIRVLETPSNSYSDASGVAVDMLSDLKVEENKNKKSNSNVRGIHLSPNISDSNYSMEKFINLLDSTELNAVVMDVKEEGLVYIADVESAIKYKAYRRSPNLKIFLEKLKEKNVYVIARIVAFRDNIAARSNPSFAVKNPDGTLWLDRQKVAWLDPYNKAAWDYVLEIAEKAVDLGFDEIQFDYIRFPSDGNTKNCRYSNRNHNSIEASKALVGFLKEANRKIKNKGAKLSIDVFGLTTTSLDDMGIGQKIVEMTKWVDFVSPMVYPSHYGKGTYGIADPDKEPYKTVFHALNTKRIPKEKLRPWLQDFSLRHRYGKKEIREQIQACYDNGIGSWLLWNVRCAYTVAALKSQGGEQLCEENSPPAKLMNTTKIKK
jgi:hypothetical protein